MNTTTTVNRGRPAGKAGTRAKRPTRIPMSGQRMRMHIEEEDKDPAFHYAWINDSRGLIQRAIKAGYEHVSVAEIPSWGTPDVDSASGTSTHISMPVGDKVIAYLMKQPMEFHDEDQAEKDRLIDAREADLKRELNSGRDGTYGKVDIA
jgi:hypothetical protein